MGLEVGSWVAVDAGGIVAVAVGTRVGDDVPEMTAVGKAVVARHVAVAVGGTALAGAPPELVREQVGPAEQPFERAPGGTVGKPGTVGTEFAVAGAAVTPGAPAREVGVTDPLLSVMVAGGAVSGGASV